MKHLGMIQAEFLKEASKWDEMSLKAQKQYLKEHPASKRKVTARPGKSTKGVKDQIKEKRQSLKSDRFDEAEVADYAVEAIPQAAWGDLNKSKNLEQLAQISDPLEAYKIVKEDEHGAKDVRYLIESAVTGFTWDERDVGELEKSKLFDSLAKNKAVQETIGREAIVSAKAILKFQKKLKQPQQSQQPQQKSKQMKPSSETVDADADAEFKQTYSNLPQELANDLFKIHSSMPQAQQGEGDIDWENGGELEFSGGSEDNWFSMGFSSPTDMADELDKFAAFVEKHGQDKVEGEERGNGVGFIIIGEDEEDEVDLGFDVNFDDVQSPEYYKDLAKFMRQHPGLKLSAYQD